MLATNNQLLPISEISTDGGTQSRAELNDEVIIEYAHSMSIGGKFPPVVVFYDGERYWLADGYHRVWAAKKANLTHISSDIKQGTLRDAILFSVGANSSHGLRRTNADKRRAVETLVKDEEWKAWSNVKMARHCGVTEFLVREVKSSIFDLIEDTQVRQVERNGKTYLQNTTAIGSRPTIPDRLQREGYEPFISSKSDEHYTPPEIIKAVINCMGEISLDPCSNSHLEPNVPAINHYTIDDDGLLATWQTPHLYMNPPYSEVGMWLKKLVQECDNGNVEEAIALVKADTSTQWFQQIWANAVAVCFAHHRLAFLGESNDGNSATFASCIAYFGSRPEQFYEAFQGKIGVCVQVIEPEFHFGR